MPRHAEEVPPVNTRSSTIKPDDDRRAGDGDDGAMGFDGAGGGELDMNLCNLCSSSGLAHNETVMTVLRYFMPEYKITYC